MLDAPPPGEGGGSGLASTTVEIVDVAPRDGLQNVRRIVAPERRAELSNRLRDAGLSRVEVASFVRDARVRQMAGAERVIAAFDRPADPAWCALVLNERGYERLLASGLRRARVTVAVSDLFNRANSNATTEDGVRAAERILARAREDGVRAGVVLATAFGCPFAGEVDPGRTLEIAARLAAFEIDELVFADTIGVATPGATGTLVDGATHIHPRIGVHLHNTRNTGYANAYAALAAGATIFDASLGGLGGCPFAPGATGNIATEDLVYLLERESVQTGIDLDAVCEVARWFEVETRLSLDGQLHRVGAFPARAPTPSPNAEVSPTQQAGPLAGVRVIELGSLIAGPFAGRLLADMGAEVIKVEAPGRPDPLREWGQGEHAGRTLWWPIQSRNKKCVTCDITTPAGRQLFLDLIQSADVLLENLRPGTLDRHGLDAETLKGANAELITCRVSGFGQTGPYASRPGFASVAEAMGGLRHINGYPGEIPPRMHISLGDSVAAIFAALGTVMALYHRDARRGPAQEVDVSLVEACFALTESMAPEYDLLGLVRGPGGTGLEGIVPSNVFEAGDGVPLIIAANSDALFARLCTAMELPGLAEDPRFATHRDRAEHRVDIEEQISDWAAGRSSAEIMETLEASGIVCGPIYTIADIFADPHFRARGMLVEQEDPELGRFHGPGVVPRLTKSPGRVCWSGPLSPGQHNDEVFGGLLGLSTEQRAALQSTGAI